MSAEHINYINTYMQPFADIFMQPRYRSDAVDLALSRHSDCFAWTTYFTANNIPFKHAILIYTLTFTSPWSAYVRQTPSGFVSPEIWIKDNYHRFRALLEGFDSVGVPPPEQGQLVPYEYTFPATAYGQQTITFSSAPLLFELYINGLKQDKSSCVLSAEQLSIPASYSIYAEDLVSVSYFLDVSGGSANGVSVGGSGSGGSSGSN